MGVKESVLAVLRGERAESTVWTIWPVLLPRGSTERAARNAGLGLVTCETLWQVHHPHVEVTERWVREGGSRLLERVYHTPIGSVRERLRADFATNNEGFLTYWTVEHPIKGPADYAVVRYIEEDALYRADYSTYERTCARFGDDGIVIANMGRSPLQRLSVELAGLERLTYDLYDQPAVVEGLLQVMAERQSEAYRLVAQSPAEIAWVPDNIAASRLSARWFERYCLGFYNQQAPVLHAAGKLFAVHMDGPVRALKDLIARCDIDVIEALTPPPMGDLSLAEARAAWPDKAIWCNFPETLFFSGARAVYEATLNMLHSQNSIGRFLLGITEDMPEEHWQSGLLAMAEAVVKSGTS